MVQARCADESQRVYHNASALAYFLSFMEQGSEEGVTHQSIQKDVVSAWQGLASCTWLLRGTERRADYGTPVLVGCS